MAAAFALCPSSASAAAPSGAIFTTVADGSEVNANIYPFKEAVFLDGGPGIGAPRTAAGLDDGVYVFQVTDPSGRRLLSTDAAACRRFTVASGIIVGVVPAGGCEHATGLDVDHGAVTVQLFPFLDTPNNGGEYKVWSTRVEDFVCSLDVVDCSSARHGFVPSASKTDNFKVKQGPPREIDVKFIDDATGVTLSGLSATWIDTLGASNVKWSYLVPFWNNVEAHVEAAEDGVHQIVLTDQPGCRVGTVVADGVDWGTGARTVQVRVKPPGNKQVAVFVHVYCLSNP
jgi:hypothetical protein